MKPKKAAHVKISKPGSKSPKKVRREPEEIKAVETTAIALLAAIHKAIEAEIRPSEKAFGTLNKVVDATAKFAALPPAPPFTALPPQQMPSVWQIAHLAALIGQSDPGKLRSLAHDLPDDPTVAMSASQDDYQSANSLTHAALTLLRSAHDMRQIWQMQPKLQGNHQAGMFYHLAPTHDEQEERQSRVYFILASLLAPKVSDKSRFDESVELYWCNKDINGQTTTDKDRFAEYWKDADFVAWNDAAILFFRDEVKDKEKATPGIATQTQRTQFALFFAEHLEKTALLNEGQKCDAAHFIKLWQKTTYATPADDRPTFLQPGFFTELWQKLILFLEARKNQKKKEVGKFYANKRWNGDGSEEAPVL